MSVRVSARAKDDFELIYAIILARQGEMAAERFIEAATGAMEFLAQYPLAGAHPRWATRHRSLRFWIISKTKYLIYYLPDESGVSIERVLDGRRDVLRIIGRGKESPPDFTK